jgi:uncharacterized protein YndB with AHSA1/START domain
MNTTQITAEPNSPQVIVTREFAAPRELVLRAYTDPELLVQWLGPHDLTMTVEYYDVRDGGTWRYVHTDAEGHAYGFHGVFHGDAGPDTIVATFEYEGAPGHVSLDTTTFQEHGGATVVRTVSSFQSVEDRDGMIAADMERGVRDSGERLETLLDTLQTA